MKYTLICLAMLVMCIAAEATPMVTDSSSLLDKAKYFQADLIEKHLSHGEYVSIVPVVPPGTKLKHTVDEPGNVIHAGVWTGRYLGAVGYQYAVTKDPQVRKLGWEILKALRIQQEVTGKPGLLARGYMRGHGPVEEYERGYNDMPHWHQGQGKYADYRWYSDVSVDNFNAVLYGYSVYYDLAADAAQKKFIAYDVDRLMTHVLDNHCRIVDVDGKVTQWGHIGIDPDPAREDYYKQIAKARKADLDALGVNIDEWRPPLKMELMLLPDLLIAHHVTGKQRYIDFYNKVIARFKDNPDRSRSNKPFLERVSHVNHSDEGQEFEALYSLSKYEHNPELIARYNKWIEDLWDMNWMEGSSLFTFMTLAMLPEYHLPVKPGISSADPKKVPHGEESLRTAIETLKLFPVDRTFRPVMNSLRKDIEFNPYIDRGGEKQAAKPIPINERPMDNEYEWKGSPYRLDGWTKPIVTAIQFSADDPQVMWFSDTYGRVYETLDGGKNWSSTSRSMMGARVQNISASKTRTFVLFAQTDKGVIVTRDGGISWLPAPADKTPAFESRDFAQWQSASDGSVFPHRRSEQASSLQRRRQNRDPVHERVAHTAGELRLLHQRSALWPAARAAAILEQGWRKVDRAQAVAGDGDRLRRLSPRLLDGKILWFPERIADKTR